MPDTSSVPAGFYDDGNGRQRYWDGSQWTARYQDLATPPTPPPVNPRASSMQYVVIQVTLKEKFIGTRPATSRSSRPLFTATPYTATA